MQGERRVGSDKLASLTLQELAKYKSIKWNDKCTKIIKKNVSSNYAVYVQKLEWKNHKNLN